MRRFVAGWAVLAACAALGCGDDDEAAAPGGSAEASSERAGVYEGLTAYGDAVKANDPEAACGQLTESARREAAETIPGASSCEDAHRTAFGALGEANRAKLAEQLAGAEYEAKISGDTATLEFPRRPEAKPLRMRRVGGEWKVDQNTLFFNRTEE
jgi:hypothetical protein